MSTERVLGVDACRAGWVGIALTGDRADAYQTRTIADLVTAVTADGPLAVVAIDIPIGLPDNSRREADVEARRAVGALASSVFMTPVRGALEFHDHGSASAHNRARVGEGMSIQAFGILPKVREVDVWLPGAPCRVVEVHPEVSFAALAGAPLAVRKHTWAGARLRHRLLTEAGIKLDDIGDPGTRAGVDDVLDAAVAAWTARRVAQGTATSLPPTPQTFTDGVASAIWR
jgi:predicted RNase H-like nuclease